jgi:RND superfamily putative drug exporter
VRHAEGGRSVRAACPVGAIVVGIVSVIASATLLPALLSALGDRVNSLRIPVIGRRSLEDSNPEGRFCGHRQRQQQRNLGRDRADGPPSAGTEPRHWDERSDGLARQVRVQARLCRAPT